MQIAKETGRGSGGPITQAPRQALGLVGRNGLMGLSEEVVSPQSYISTHGKFFLAYTVHVDERRRRLQALTGDRGAMLPSSNNSDDVTV